MTDAGYVERLCPVPGCGKKVKLHKPFGSVIYQCEAGHKFELSLDEIKPSDENLLEETENQV